MGSGAERWANGVKMKLHITNGDCAGDMLNRSERIQGDVLCWKDLLHDGPVLALPYEAYSKARTTYLMSLLKSAEYSGEITEQMIAADFVTRKNRLDNIEIYDEVVLWFEHDLYDQLQLLEICHRLLNLGLATPPVSIICIDRHPEIPYFYGLGNLTLEMMEELFNQRVPLSQHHLIVADTIWSFFTAPSPENLARVAQTEIAEWPFMAAALRRFCLEYPSIETGLTLTQTYLLLTLLRAPDELPALEYTLKQSELKGLLPEGVTATERYYEILSGPATFRRVFNHLQQLESAPFMGDLSVRSELNRLMNADLPYISKCLANGEEVFSLTVAGAEALQGKKQWQADNPSDFWRGGVHLTSEAYWLWDEHLKQFNVSAYD